MEKLKRILPPKISAALENMSDDELLKLTEIRLRIMRPVYFYMGKDEYGVDECGLSKKDGYIFSQEDAFYMWKRLCDGSPYSTVARQRAGYITVDGNRIGFAGQYATVEDSIKHIDKIFSFCVRIMHEKKGCANKIYRYIYENNDLLNTLIVSPPGCGKTTMLRDITRLLSFDGYNVSVVDERDEIASQINGIPTLDIGKRTDVYSGISKPLAIENMIRSMKPDIIVADELGADGDFSAMKNAKIRGVKIIATAHGRYLEDIKVYRDIFERYIILSDRFGVGTVEGIYDRAFKECSKICC